MARQNPGLSAEDPPGHRAGGLDIAKEAMTNVLARLRQGPLADEQSYLLRVVYTRAAQMLREPMRPTLSLDHERGADGVGGLFRVARVVLPPGACRGPLPTPRRDVGGHRSGASVAFKRRGAWASSDSVARLPDAAGSA